MFFFKQKTAYEVRISDWSSDVCSSDLFPSSIPNATFPKRSPTWPKSQLGADWALISAVPRFARSAEVTASIRARPFNSTLPSTGVPSAIVTPHAMRPVLFAFPFGFSPSQFQKCVRSEEHTSELQSLMRISYAVFCLKKKKQHTYKTPRIYKS